MNFDYSKYPERKYLKRSNQPGYMGWQFAYERSMFPENKFFNDKKYGGVEGAYQAAKKYRNEFLESALELDIINHAREKPRIIPIDIKLAPNNTSGIIGVCRSVSNRSNRNRQEITWSAGYKNAAGQSRQKSFQVYSLGEQKALFEAVKFRKNYVQSLCEALPDAITEDILKKHIEELEDILHYIAELVDEADIFFFLGTLNNPLLDNTSKKEMLDVRIGQNRFRKLVLNYWNHKCAVTGTKMFITAGHIKPWKDADNSERLDVFNGLALSPVYDKAFDKGYISFDKKGSILISKKLKDDAKLLGIDKNNSIENLNYLHQKYLTWHRENIYIK